MSDVQKRKLSMADRRALPKSAFVFPERAPESGSYPIPDETHARAALHYADMNASPADKAKVYAAVGSRFPEVLAHWKQGKAQKSRTTGVVKALSAGLRGTVFEARE